MHSSGDHTLIYTSLRIKILNICIVIVVYTLYIQYNIIHNMSHHTSCLTNLPYKLSIDIYIIPPYIVIENEKGYSTVNRLTHVPITFLGCKIFEIFEFHLSYPHFCFANLYLQKPWKIFEDEESQRHHMKFFNEYTYL